MTQSVEKLFCVNKELDEEALHHAFGLFQQHSPEGAFGKLEEIALRLASQQGQAIAELETPWVTIFAADHGVAQENVSAMTSLRVQKSLTAINQGVAPTNRFANFCHASLELVDVGMTQACPALPADTAVHRLISAQIAAGTKNFSQTAAMSESELLAAMQVGTDAVERANSAGAKLFVAGDLGVGSTTAAAAMTALLSGKPVAELVGEGSGISLRQRKHKAQVIEQALALHESQLTSPLRVLQYLGGFEMAAMVGAYLRCAQLGITVLVDGLVSSVAVWVADFVSRNEQLAQCTSIEKLWDLGKYSIPETLFCTCGSCPRVVDWCFFAQLSAEPAHAVILEALGVEPLLQLELRTGAATGALLVVPMLQQACWLQQTMAKSHFDSIY